MPILTAPQIREELTKAFGTPTRTGAVEAFSRIFQNFLGFFLTDAPSDGKTYGRKDGDWEIVTGAGNSCEALVQFGASFGHLASAVVTGQTWVTANSRIAVTVAAQAPADAVETALMQFSTSISDIVPGVGFTLNVYTPIEAKGDYFFNCVGV